MTDPDSAGLDESKKITIHRFGPSFFRFQRLRPLKSKLERRGLRRKGDFSELEVVPRSLRRRLNKEA